MSCRVGSAIKVVAILWRSLRAYNSSAGSEIMGFLNHFGMNLGKQRWDECALSLHDDVRDTLRIRNDAVDIFQ